MARIPTTNDETKVTLTEEEIAALAAKDAEEAPEVEVVRVRAKFNRMRNPYTGAVFTTQKDADVIDLQSKDNCWTRDQINAKVLEIV